MELKELLEGVEFGCFLFEVVGFVWFIVYG